MNIFESLENLNVSEECFSDIINIIEEITQEIVKKYGNPTYAKDENGYIYEPWGDKRPKNKSAQLLDKVGAARYEERRSFDDTPQTKGGKVYGANLSDKEFEHIPKKIRQNFDGGELPEQAGRRYTKNQNPYDSYNIKSKAQKKALNKQAEKATEKVKNKHLN